jgi:hypothetical protein
MASTAQITAAAEATNKGVWEGRVFVEEPAAGFRARGRALMAGGGGRLGAAHGGGSRLLSADAGGGGWMLRRWMLIGKAAHTGSGLAQLIGFHPFVGEQFLGTTAAGGLRSWQRYRRRSPERSCETLGRHRRLSITGGGGGGGGGDSRERCLGLCQTVRLAMRTDDGVSSMHGGHP